MAYSTESYGLSKFEKLQNCCQSSENKRHHRVRHPIISKYSYISAK